MVEKSTYQAPQLDENYRTEYLFRMNQGKSEKARRMLPFIPDIPPYRILNIGSGGGGLENEMRQVFPHQHIIALDYSLPMIEDLQEQQNHLPKDVPHIECLAARADTIPLADNSISTVSASSVIHEIATFGDKFTFGNNTNNFFLEAWRVLCPGGRLIIRDFMQVSNPDTLIKCRVGSPQPGDPTDPAEFLTKFLHDFRGSDLSYISKQLSKPISMGTELLVTQADALEIAGHFSWSRRYQDEVKEKYAYFPIQKYVGHITSLYQEHYLPAKVIHQSTELQSGYPEHIDGRFDFFSINNSRLSLPILTGLIVIEK